MTKDKMLVLLDPEANLSVWKSSKMSESPGSYRSDADNWMSERFDLSLTTSELLKFIGFEDLGELGKDEK